MSRRSRREFMAEVGRGMLVASVGSATALDLGLSRSLAEEVGDVDERLTFGPLERLASLMQETPPEKLLPLLDKELRSGTELKTLVAAAALANARAFGGQDYTGFHTFMALAPALQIAGELPSERQALPVFKVLYRNSSRIQEQGFHDHDTLHPVHAGAAVDLKRGEEKLRDSVRAVDWTGAENRFAALAAASVEDAYNDLQLAVQDDLDVHRVVLAWRAWAMLGLAGQEHAHTLLRQSVRYCLNVEQSLRDRNAKRSDIRQALPRMLDAYHLVGKPLGNREADDAWVEKLAGTIFSGTRDDAAEAVASALAEGFHPEAVGDAISLAANMLVLHDPGRRQESSTPGKPPGCVHGDSVGVHASDAANAWRNIARVGNARNRVASLIVGAYHTAGQTDWVTKDPYPYADRLDAVQGTTPEALLGQVEEAITSNDQAGACAAVHRYGEQNLPERRLFDLLVKYAVSEDGALHAEKYYRTVSEEFAAARPAFRWRQLTALARVTASEHGFPAPGYQQACELLGVS
jgi:hypothetical protein